MVVLSLVGTLAITLLAVRPNTVVREAIAQAARRMPVLLGAAILIGLAVALALLPLFALAGPAAGAGAGARVAPSPVLLLVLPVILFIGVRLQMMSAVAAVERTGVLGVIRRSWQLTRGHFWKILAFLLLLIVLFVVLSVAVTVLGGLLVLAVAGPPIPGSVSALVVLLLGGLLSCVLLVLATVMLGRIYLQLAGAEEGASSAT